MLRKIVVVVILFVAMGFVCGMAQAGVIVLKEGALLTTGGALAPNFSGVTAANIVPVTVEDSGIVSNPAAKHVYFGQQTADSGMLAELFKFPLVSIPAGSTVNKAQLRLRATGGNTGVSLGRVLYHDWAEATVTLANPNDFNQLQPDGWGAASNAILSLAGDASALVAFESAPGGVAWLVKDVTVDVQAFVAGTYSNYGWGVNAGNHALNMTENTDDGSRPALFIDFTEPPPPVAPVAEPAVLGLMGLGLPLLRRRRRA